MADLRVSMDYTLRLSSAELRLISRALRGELAGEEEAQACELQERLMLSRAQQAQQLAEETAKTATNIERKRRGP